MTLSWFFSKKVREVTDLVRQADKLYRHQRDILAPQANAAILKAIVGLRAAIKRGATQNELTDLGNALNDAAGKWLKPYPAAGVRENVEVILVAIVIAMAVRTYFLQPFKIPTGSMQPTLFGVTSENLRAAKSADPFPGLAGRVYQAVVGGTFFHELIADQDGEIIGIASEKVFRFINKSIVRVRYSGRETVDHALWFTPEEKFSERAGIGPGLRFKKGDPIVRMKEVAGDHLFVNRLAYNFRKPTLGEIIVFETTGIPGLAGGQFYIKRLVGLGGDELQIGTDRHLVRNGVRLGANTENFEMVYGGGGTKEWKFLGHLNETHRTKYAPGLMAGQLAPLFPDEKSKYSVPAGFLMVMGDNTANSYDSRAWGAFDEKKVIGKSAFVYWPIINHDGHRWGWAHR